jgi:serine/threonine protein kinase
MYHRLDAQYYAVKRVLLTENSIHSALQEIRILASISHPRIIRYFHSWVEAYDEKKPITGDTEQERLEEETLLVFQDQYFFLFLQMECCEMNLKDFMTRAPCRLDEVQTIFTQILEGLDYLHKNGVIHRDIKPDNILLRTISPLSVKISDFGLAKVFRDTTLLTDHSVYAGTYLYAAPEQFAGRECSWASDVYSLGIILYELQTRFSTDMERIQKLVRLRDHHQMDEDLPYRSMVLWMTQGDARLRPTMEQVRFLMDGGFQNVAIWCRDIAWEIVWKTYFLLP